MISNDGCSAACIEQKVVQVSGGDFHTCALLDIGAVPTPGKIFASAADRA